ncbi:MAG: magnesium transporter [Gemmatimonadetes bacterium]|nr:magnesium transporter [Gemmatimonadota bacterium]MDA1102871.1 magnesium transporter [Gemmatimonadota bacterium]
MSPSIEEKDALAGRIEMLVETGDLAAVAALVGEFHASDLADLVEELEEAAQIALLSALPAELASETLAEMEEGEERGHLLAALTLEKGAELLEELADDDAADLMGELEPQERKRLLGAMSDQAAGELIDLLKYDDETAGGLMTTELVAVQRSLTAAEALEQVRIQGREVEEFYTVFVIDDQRQLLGTLRLDDLVIADPDDHIEPLIHAPVATVAPTLDQEEVGRLIARYNLASVAVVSESGILLGRITFDDVIDVIEAEQTEDILRLAGVADEDELRSSWTDAVRTRLPWLTLNLVTAALAASMILVFENVVDQILTLAFLAPIIAAMGGSSGTQSLAITIRRITIEGTGGARGFVAKELMVGLVNGAVLGTGIALLAFVLTGDRMLGLVVLLAMWGNQIVAGFAGAFVPATLDRLGVDPSVASSVFVHTLTDLCGFFLLLGLASKLLLGG